MDVNEKVIARQLFQNKILKSDGQAFEDLFTDVMNYAEPDFQQIKPWGNIGDRKNDGYIKTKGIFYQVYAPEDIQKSYPEAIRKLKDNFEELISQWSPINEFYFVVNDKMKGVHADSENIIKGLKDTYSLKNAGFLTTKDIENILFKLSDDQLMNAVSFIPDPSKIKKLDFSILSEVIGHLMELPLNASIEYNINLPDWDKKIKFNNLTDPVAQLLNKGYLHVVSLNVYLSNNGDFLADTLRDIMNNIYYQQKDKYNGDKLFWAIMNIVSPKEKLMYQDASIILMAKYFETCDIFKEPTLEELE